MSLRLRTTALFVAVASAGGMSAAALGASGSGRDGDDDDGTTTQETGTTGTTTTGTTTTGTTTTPTTTTPAPSGGTPRAPRIVEGEVDDVAGNRLRLRAEVQARSATVTSVRFVYRGRTITARRSEANRNRWSRVVAARGGDGDDDVITFTIRACAGTRCTSRLVRDDA